ncbi:MAG: hypothetical protein K9L89_08700 [Kiritimatiellales bacterium]|nr:hypothetical protein [Kiritimatiellales bacterium]
MEHTGKQGFTLIEAIGAVAITTVALGLAIGGLVYSLKHTNQNDVQSELDIDVQLAMERLKMDLRLSSLDEIFYYPAGPGPYTAISFPMAEDNDGDGLFELDADGKIIWDKTVVYHVWPSSPHQLRVTTFVNRDNSLSDTQRQAQLNSVVATGAGTTTYNGANASSHVIFENLLEWAIRPQQSIFDSYSPISERETASLGFALLSNGAHTFKFKVAGKNASASGYRIGIDQLQVSPSYSDREAEAQLPVVAQSGATAIAQYMPSGSWKGNYQLYFPATAVGQSFSLSMKNDRWEETNFGETGYTAEDTDVIFDESLSPKDFTVQLRGNDVTWEAALQTDTPVPSSVTNATLKGAYVFVHINGSELLTNGNWIAYTGRKCQLTFQAGSEGRFQVDSVYIGKTTLLEDTAFAFDSSIQVKFSSGSTESPIMNTNQTATTEWIDMEINRTNNYMVAFHIKNDMDKCYPKSWKNNRTTISDCVVNSSRTNSIFGLASITASYPANGTYTSQIFDTRLDAPIYRDIAWNSVVPVGTVLTTKVRSGDQPDLSDASAWSALAPSSVTPRSVGASYKRYIQFQVQMESNSTGLSTPKLKDLTIDWTGDTQLVNISGTFTKGPAYGIVEVLVDDMPLQSALSIDLLIYRDVYGLNKTTRQVTSSLVAYLRPRNTGK